MPNSGTVAFKDEGGTISGCGAPAVNTSTGKATCEVTYNSAGVHHITATFSGSEDTSYSGSSTSSPTTVIATQATTTTLSVSPSPTVGAPVIYTATVTAIPSSGAVSFYDNGIPIGGCEAQPVNTVSGIATCEVTSAQSGTNSISASFSGSGNGMYAASHAEEPATVVVLTVPISSQSGPPVTAHAVGTAPSAVIVFPRECVSRRKVTIRLTRHLTLPGGATIKSAEVLLGGRVVARLTGSHPVAHVSLVGRAKGAFKVRILVVTSTNKTRTTVVILHTCVGRKRK